VLGRLLYPLDQRQQALLLTALTFGGKSGHEVLALLPDEDQAALSEKINALEEIPREKRVPLMLRQLRQLMSFRDRKGLEGVEPSWLIAGFRGEAPRTVAIVLMHMPSSVARQIVSRLPPKVREAMPPRAELSGVPLDVVKLVRARFDAKFAAMPTERKTLEELRFRDLVVLTARELVTLIRKLGAEELACAFVAVGKRALAEFLRRLPPREAEELIAAVKRVAREDSMEVKAAQAFLGRVLDNFHNTDELFQKAGIWRLARGVQLEDELFIRQLSQRFPRAHGRLLAEYLSRLRKRGDDEEEALSRLRDSLLKELVDLSRRGRIDQRYAQADLILEG
jgi:flagellar motor switch protein FliG